MGAFRSVFSAGGRVMDCLTPLGDLAARVWVAYVFFKSALVKISSWQTTLMLFAHEYKVPFLSPEAAAYLGTGLELILPIFLILGLGGRLIIFLFFAFNVVAIISYPFLLTPEGGHGLAQHINWGLLLALLMFHGAGKWSLDYWIRGRKRSDNGAAS